MSVENDFLPFAAASGANVIDQATYAGLSALPAGFQSGVASSAQINKVLRQASLMAAVLASLIVDKSGQPAIDDGTTATLEANLIAAIQAVAESVGLTQTQADARYALLNGADAQIFKVANATANDEAVNLGQADARYAALAGLASQIFNVANATQASHAANYGQVIGLGQTWQDVTASRALGTTYTNSTGKPILVVVGCYTATSSEWTMTVNGIALGDSGGANTSMRNTISAIVPAGGTYSVNSNGQTLVKWTELR